MNFQRHIERFHNGDVNFEKPGRVPNRQLAD